MLNSHDSVPVVLPKRRQATTAYSSALSPSKCNTLPAERDTCHRGYHQRQRHTKGESVVFTGMLRRALCARSCRLETELSQDWQSIVDCFWQRNIASMRLVFFRLYLPRESSRRTTLRPSAGSASNCACVIDCHCRHSSRHLSLRLAGRMADHRSTALHCLPNSG